ncbi:hypothetical protein L228DRAFT_242703 [Xylona heveae TC161]|uniref:Uncharacterized protein n=1 Tax=Xylona heveae (strain CBS 132557 / TC161) TaxID=1328760 RepID=A0A165JHY4_XYLHT|nr:hypothetical protein L228DRAFT_242703 [Xylona heveae TC161]KZF26261.1 hypothetical protein L228DRAFT_242703 [Xylona heveae TC161]
MSSTRSSSGGVRNLRAMFEQSNNESSTSHSPVRSPLGLDGQAASGADGDRPTNRVRASFVSVGPSEPVEEQSGKGRKNSGSESMSARRGSFCAHQESDPGIIEDAKETVGHEFQERRKSVIIDEIIPESALEATPAATPIVELPEHPLKSSALEEESSSTDTLAGEASPSVNMDKPVSAQQDEDAKLLPADPKDEAVVDGNAAIPQPVNEPQESHKESEAISKPLEEPPVGTTKQNATPQSPQPLPAETANEDEVAAPLESSSAGPNNTVESEKPVAEESAEVVQPTMSSTPPRNKHAPSAISSPSSSSKSHAPASQPPSQSASPTRSKKSIPIHGGAPAQSPGAASVRTRRSSVLAQPHPPPATTARPARPTTNKQTVTSSGAKSRSKSPTRPARLPAAATVPTASSAAKSGTGSSPSRSNNLSRKSSKVARNPSSGTRPTAQPSTVSRKPQAPSAQDHSERPGSRASHPGPKISRDDFFARMMRPTASSASKVHEKVEPKTHAPAKKPLPKSGSSATHAPRTGLTEGSHKVQGRANGSAAVGGPVERSEGKDSQA